MNQQEFDEILEDKYPSQVHVQPEMKEELIFLRHCFEQHNLYPDNRQLMYFWEHYSDAYDASWHSANLSRVQGAVNKFIFNPQEWLEYPLYKVDLSSYEQVSQEDEPQIGDIVFHPETNGLEIIVTDKTDLIQEEYYPLLNNFGCILLRKKT